jgi:hypothetical protein
MIWPCENKEWNKGIWNGSELKYKGKRPMRQLRTKWFSVRKELGRKN